MPAQLAAESFLIISYFKIWSIWFQSISDFQTIITCIVMLHELCKHPPQGGDEKVDDQLYFTAY